jgi:hypothetical protein
MIKYEVAIYNADVRECVEAGDRHRDLSDDWADMHYIIVEADDEKTVRAQMEKKYPSERGFVIDSIHLEP